MPSVAGINRIISGEVSQSKTTGKAFLREYYKAFSPEAIAKKKPTSKKK